MIEGQPVVWILRPANSQTTKVVLPRERPLDHPATRGVTLLFRYFRDRYTPAGDVHMILPLVSGLANVLRIIAFVTAQVMHPVNGFRAWHNCTVEQLHRIVLVMRVGTGDLNREGRTTPIHQDMSFGTQFAAIRRIFACLRSTQRSGHTLAVNGLPMPFDSLTPMIKLDHQLEELSEHTAPTPGLVTCMQTAARTEPGGLQRFPLATRPQNVQETVDHLAIRQRRASDGAGCFIRWQDLFKAHPQGIGNGPNCGITDGGTPCRRVGRDTTILLGSAISINSKRIYG